MSVPFGLWSRDTNILFPIPTKGTPIATWSGHVAFTADRQERSVRAGRSLSLAVRSVIAERSHPIGATRDGAGGTAARHRASPDALCASFVDVTTFLGATMAARTQKCFLRVLRRLHNAMRARGDTIQAPTLQPEEVSLGQPA